MALIVTTHQNSTMLASLAVDDLHFGQGLNCQKISGRVDICLFIVIVITHRRLSIINNGGGLKLTPQGIPGHLVWGGLSKQLGGSTPNPPAIQTLILDVRLVPPRFHLVKREVVILVS
jgi:hypothetical protein